MRLNKKQRYWTIAASESNCVDCATWDGDRVDRTVLKNGLYTNKEHALHTAAALFGIQQ